MRSHFAIVLLAVSALILPADATASAAPHFGPNCTTPACLSRPPTSFPSTVEIYVALMNPAKQPKSVAVSDVSIPARGLTGTFIGNARYRSVNVPLKPGFSNFRYDLTSTKLVSGHRYWVQVEGYPDYNLGGNTYTATGPGPWQWSFTQTPPPVVK